jgi:hypothetical protein
LRIPHSARLIAAFACAAPPTGYKLAGLAGEVCRSEAAAAAYWKTQPNLHKQGVISIRSCVLRRLQELQIFSGTCDELSRFGSRTSPTHEQLTRVILEKTIGVAKVGCLTELRAEKVELRESIHGLRVCAEQDRVSKIHLQHYDRLLQLGLASREEVECRRRSFPQHFEIVCRDGDVSDYDENAACPSSAV